VDAFEDGDGCPEADNDADGIADGADRCMVLAEDRDGFEDENGCPDEDNDSDKILDSADACPLVPEDVDGFEDSDGCADPLTSVRMDVVGAGGVALPDAAVTIQGASAKSGAVAKLPAGPVTLSASALGYRERSLGYAVVNGPPVQLTIELEPVPPAPPTKEEKVVVSRDRIEFYDKIFFDTNKATIKKQSYAILDAIAEALVAHPEVTRLRIEGHTDDVGDAAKNKKLSEGRAASVRDYLVKKGVATERLVPVGRGEESPVDAAKTAAAREKNRRVELHIEARTP
jgi:outer membrane protein OmpA-like peptidoglycan-associated protein